MYQCSCTTEGSTCDLIGQESSKFKVTLVILGECVLMEMVFHCRLVNTISSHNTQLL